MDPVIFESLKDLFVALTALVCMTVIPCLYFYFRYRGKREVLATLRKAMEHGQDLTPEVMSMLGHARPDKDSDLRRAIMTLAVGVGILGFGMFMEGKGAFQPMLGIGFLVMLIGVAYLGLWRFSDGRQR